MTSAAPILYLVMQDTLVLPCQDVQSDPSSNFFWEMHQRKGGQVHQLSGCGVALLSVLTVFVALVSLPSHKRY